VCTINLISSFCYCLHCCVSAIIHAVTTSFYDELTDLLDRLEVLILLILLPTVVVLVLVDSSSSTASVSELFTSKYNASSQHVISSQWMN